MVSNPFTTFGDWFSAPAEGIVLTCGPHYSIACRQLVGCGSVRREAEFSSFNAGHNRGPVARHRRESTRHVIRRHRRWCLRDRVRSVKETKRGKQMKRLSGRTRIDVAIERRYGRKTAQSDEEKI